jgi:hypothetical protein
MRQDCRTVQNTALRLLDPLREGVEEHGATVVVSHLEKDLRHGIETALLIE